MVGGLGKVGGQLCDAAHSGPTLQYSTFRRLLQGTAGADCGTAVVGGQWPVASSRLPGTAGDENETVAARGMGICTPFWDCRP